MDASPVGDLLLDVVHQRLHRRALGGVGLLVQVVHVDVVRDGHLAARDGVDEVGLARAVVSDEAVARACDRGELHVLVE